MIVWGECVDLDLRRALEAAGLDSVAGAFAYAQGRDLAKPDLGTRRRTRLTLTDPQGRSHELYLKRYGPGRWWQRLGKFTSPARGEFKMVQRVRQAGVPTMREIVMGEECPLMDGRSFLIVSAVPGEAVEREGAKWFAHSDQTVVEAMTDKLASLVRTLHAAGLVHRDLYASHVFAHGRGGAAELYLIDLARVFRPCWRKFRWRTKDLAQLHFSMPAAWVQKHWPRFMEKYLGAERAGQADHRQNAILRKSQWIRRRQLRKAGLGGAGDAK